MQFLVDKLRIFFSKRGVFWSLILSLSVNFYLWYLIYNFINFQRDWHVLHYNVYFGIDLLGSPLKLLNIPFIGLGVFILNLLIAFILYNLKNDLVLIYFFLLVGFFINLELIIYLLGIIRMEY